MLDAILDDSQLWKKHFFFWAYAATIKPLGSIVINTV